MKNKPVLISAVVGMAATLLAFGYSRASLSQAPTAVSRPAQTPTTVPTLGQSSAVPRLGQAPVSQSGAKGRAEADLEVLPASAAYAEAVAEAARAKAQIRAGQASRAARADAGVRAMASPQSEGLTPGRFQIATSEGHVFVLDTATGQVWEKFVATNSGETSPQFSNPKVGPGSGR